MNLHPKFKKGLLGATLATLVLAGLRLFGVEIDESAAGIITGAAAQVGVWLGGDQAK